MYVVLVMILPPPRSTRHYTLVPYTTLFRAHGYGYLNSDWKATPDALRKAVYAYIGANQHTKDLYIEQIQLEPKMARAVGQLIGEREVILQRDRGMSL